MGDGAGGDGLAGAGNIPPHLLDRIARAIHDDYLRDRLAEDGVMGTEPALRPWEDLPEHLRDANRAQAVGYVDHLEAIGYTVATDAGTRQADLVLRREQLEQLARAEHDRWLNHKLSQGYHYGPSRIDDGTQRRHPSLVSWEELTEEVRDLDRQPLRRMVDTLAAADLRIVPLTPSSGLTP
jgi:RyR domain